MIAEAAVVPVPQERKRILVLISHGGGGHVAAGESLKEILGRTYDVSVMNVFGEMLRPADPLNWISGGRFTGEDLYNFCLKRHRGRWIQWMASYGTRHMKRKKVERAFDRFLQRQANIPDLIISTAPFVNFGLACATDQWKIPLMVLPTDLDGSTFLYGFPSRLRHHRFRLALAYDDLDIRKVTLQGLLMCEDHLAVVGFPVRSACLKSYTESDCLHLKQKHQLLESFQTVTLLMGAIGGNLILDHAKVLAGFDPRPYQLNVQFNICVGHNHMVGAKIHSYLRKQGAAVLSPMSLVTPQGVVFHIRGFMREILEIMAVSDLVITKTGSCTVNEAIYLNKPLLLDNTQKSTARHLWWEQFNIPFVEKHQLGHAFADAKQLHMLIPSLLKYPTKREGKKLVLPPFKENIEKIVAEMIS